MVLPEGVPKANTIVKLKKALYGLKTAPRLWHKTINAFLLSLESMQSEADPNLYIRRNKLESDVRHDRSNALYPPPYVDDMQILYPRTATATAEDIKTKLMKQFKNYEPRSCSSVSRNRHSAPRGWIY